MEDDQVEGDFETDGSSGKQSSKEEGKSNRRKKKKHKGGERDVVKRQTLLFSATMMLDGAGRKNAKVGKGKKGMKGGVTSTATILQDLMNRVGCRGEPAIVDVTKSRKITEKPSEASSSASSSSSATSKQQDKEQAKKDMKQFSLPEGLELARIDCTQEDKDLYVYYFCMKVSIYS